MDPAAASAAEATPLESTTNEAQAAPPAASPPPEPSLFDRVFRPEKVKEHAEWTARQAVEEQKPSEPPPAPPRVRLPSGRELQLPNSPQEFEALLPKVVQSEVDQEAARREELARGREVQELTRLEKEARRDGDTTLAEEYRIRALALQDQAEQDDSLAGTVGRVAEFFDNVFLDAYLQRIEGSARQKIFGTPRVGVDGRLEMVAEIAAQLEAQGEARGYEKARQELPKDPTFVKQLLHANLNLLPPNPGRLAQSPQGGSPAGTGSRSPMDVLIREAAGVTQE